MRLFIRKLVCVSAGLLGLASVDVRAEEALPPPDLLTLANGAVVVRASVDLHGALALTDGNGASHWSASTKKKPLPYTFVFELIAPAVLTAVGTEGAGARPGGVAGGSAGPVLIEGSAEGPDSGYSELARIMAAPDGQTLADIDPPGPVRWLRFTIEGAQTAEVPWLYVSEVVAQGAVTPPDDPERFTGVFQSGRKDFIELHQDGALISGCYVENSGRSTGKIAGAVENGVALVTWTSEQGISGPALLTRDSSGALSGARYRQRSRSGWGGPVAPEGTTTPCSPQVTEASAEPAVDPIVQALEEIGQVRIYGIHFEYDSDVPKPSAAAALTRLHAALASAPGLNVTIEGHTDADGGDGYNLDLSARRAASVVGWLVAQGIDAGRLVPQGKGEAEPVASNETADGKALNRRVEVRRR
ncbi:OmpA family protein [Seohaeicola saemankumensis]|nr:OmpA family protein [Seohaeicola saemankumensis]MCA0870991.1 OmpA family protein [Seohaeicola saemankumensis]